MIFPLKVKRAIIRKIFKGLGKGSYTPPKNQLPPPLPKQENEMGNPEGTGKIVTIKDGHEENTFILRGYQPKDDGRFDRHNPPKGGSGLKNPPGGEHLKPPIQYRYFYKRFILPTTDSLRLNELMEDNLNEWANDGWKVVNILRSRPGDEPDIGYRGFTPGTFPTPLLGSGADVVYFDVLFERIITKSKTKKTIVVTVPCNIISNGSNMLCPNCGNHLFEEDYKPHKGTYMVTQLCDVCGAEVIFNLCKKGCINDPT